MTTATIERIETCLVDLPTIRPHKLSVATMHGQTLMLVKVFCSDGVLGIGEGTTIAGLAYGPESPESMKLAIDAYLAPAAIGKDATRIQELMAYIGKLVKVNHFAKSALETALLDAHGKRLNVPVSELLGGRRRERLAVAWTLASGDTAKDIVEAERMLELRRHRVFKLKIGAKELKTDIKHVAQIKKELGDRGAVRVDVNMAWSETQAAWAIPALADAGCELVEQPVASAAALARLMRRFPIALMADEILQGPESAFEIAKNDGADVFAIKIEQSGGSIRGAARRCHRGLGRYRIVWRHDAGGRVQHCCIGASVRELCQPAMGHRIVRAAADHRRDLGPAARLQQFRTDGAERPGSRHRTGRIRVRRFTRDAR